MVAGFECPPPPWSSAGGSGYQAEVFRISGSGTHRQFLVFKSPLHALPPVPEQIFLPKPHPNEVSSGDDGQELFASLWSAAETGAACAGVTAPSCLQ